MDVANTIKNRTNSDEITCFNFKLTFCSQCVNKHYIYGVLLTQVLKA